MIQYIINTLNQIEVKGRDNLDKMLGAIMALESMLDAQNKEMQKRAEATNKTEESEMNG